MERTLESVGKSNKSWACGRVGGGVGVGVGARRARAVGGLGVGDGMGRMTGAVCKLLCRLLDSTRLDWTGLDWTGLHATGLGW